MGPSGPISIRPISNRGTLLIGITDEGLPFGIEADAFESTDEFRIHLATWTRDALGATGSRRASERLSASEPQAPFAR